MSHPRFFALIIGTEILNRRRQDKHFAFVSEALARYGHRLSGSFVIEDDPQLIIQTLQFIAAQSDTVLLSFGGIGSTPDDYTRQAAATALSNGELYQHEEALSIIQERFQGEAIPDYALEMGQFPKDAQILENPFNKMPGFSLQDRFFFMPGFPSMSHPMTEYILQTYFAIQRVTYRYTLTALCKESQLIEIMKQVPKEVELSSLPKFYSDGWKTIISVASEDQKAAEASFALFTNALDEMKVYYSLGE
ncbi:MAG: competence/damage-inducible protein A [Campylobacterales bacterium]|nr:competence/damage-inducible protein A [Campylobacterales bacterium]